MSAGVCRTKQNNCKTSATSSPSSIGQASKGQDIAPLLAEVSGLGERLEAAKEAFADVQGQLQAFLHAIPNLPDELVPTGKDEADNQQLRIWGEPRTFEFEPQDHVDLGGAGGLDFETAAKSGSRYVVMHGGIARLHRALTQFMLDTHVQQHGYQEVYVPYIVNADSLFGTGQLPKFAEDQFRIDQEQDLLNPNGRGAGNQYISWGNFGRVGIADSSCLSYAVFSQRGWQLWARYPRHDSAASI